MRSAWCILLIIQLLQSGTRADYLNITQHEGNYSQIMNLTFNKNSEQIVVYPASSSKYPYRVEAWSTTSTNDLPILVVVRQDKEVLSWQIPLPVEISQENINMYFRNTSRTLCYNNLMTNRRTSLADSQNLIISFTTPSPSYVDIYTKVEEQQNFYLEKGANFSFAVSPSEPQYYYYKFDNDTDNILLEFDSDDDVCLVVSIQDGSCPLFDLDSDITYEGQFQIINRKGGAGVYRKDYPNGFFLVFVAKGDNYDCIEEHNLTPRRSINNRTSIVTVSIIGGISTKDYVAAISATLAAIAGFCAIVYAIIRLFDVWRLNYDQLDHTENIPPEEDGEPLTLDRLSRTAVTTEGIYNYTWYTAVAAIFYVIPVVQLVYTRHKVSDATGDEDMCYYNFLCANPFWVFSDFNHVFSNVGYVFMGMFFMFSVYCHHKTVPDNNSGVPINDDIFYAMGIALIAEGLLSACYHFCPSRPNFQFDTSFMYVKLVLCMVKLYQKRHTDVTPKAHQVFTVLGVVVTLALLGILYGIVEIQVALVLLYLLLYTYISLKMHFCGSIYSGFKRLMGPSGDKCQFSINFAALGVIYGIGMAGPYLCQVNSIDFGTLLLLLLFISAIKDVAFYTIMKIKREKICLQASAYAVLAVFFWIAAGYFFLNFSARWSVSPAESRNLNQKCIFLDFYDVHDIWHLLSAAALYMTFMYLLCIDDDLFGKRRETISVF